MSSQTAPTAADAAAASAAENRLARNILLGVLVAVVLAVVLIAAGGLPMLGILGMILTLVVFALMIAFTLGS